MKNVGTVDDLKKKLKMELHTISLHLFIPSWQFGQYSQLRGHLPKNWVLMIHDVSEKYRTIFASEVQSADFNYHQITLHTSVTFYKCPTEGCADIVEENFVCITDNSVHAREERT